MRFAGALLAALHFSAVATADPRTVAVSYFDNTSNDASLDPLRKGLADMLITDLAGVTSLRIVEREKLEALVKEIKLGKSAYFDPKTAQQLGKGLGAEFVLTGSYLLVGDDLRIDVRLVKVQTGEIVAADKAQGQKADFFDIEKELVDLLVRSLDLKLERTEKRAISKKQTESFEAVQRYSTGLDARDRGDEEKAAEAFRAALEADPDYQAAQSAMGRLKVILKRADAANASELAEIEAKSRTPEFGKWLQDLLQRIGYAFDTPKLRQRITVLRFIVERDLKPIVRYGETVVNVEPIGLYTLAQSFTSEPETIELVPPVFEYLFLKYPQDSSFSGYTATLPYLEQSIAKVREAKKRVAALAAEEASGGLFITEESSKESHDTPCRRLPDELRDFGNGVRLLAEATHDTARIEAYVTKFLDRYLARREQLCTTELDRKITGAGLDGLYVQVSGTFATIGDLARFEKWFGRITDLKSFGSSRESFLTMLQGRRPVFETREEARALLKLVETKSRKPAPK